MAFHVATIFLYFYYRLFFKSEVDRPHAIRDEVLYYRGSQQSLINN